MKNILNNKLIQQLTNLKLDTQDFAIFGSAPMWLHGLRDNIDDLDIIARGKAWERAVKIGIFGKSQSGSGQVVRFKYFNIEIFDEWGPGIWNVDELIDTAEEIGGIRFVNLENVKKWKLIYGRDKDLKDVQRIDSYLAQ